MNLTLLDVEPAWERYQDLLREADKQRLMAEAGIRAKPQLDQQWQRLVQATVCRASLFSQTRVCALSASAA